MATYIDVITGFLESGKTTFIKEIIQKDCFMEYEKSVLIVCEEGFEEYNQKALEKQKIKTVMVEDNSELSEQLFANIKQTYSPDYILVEYNGTWNIESLFCLKLPFSYHIRNVLFLSDADKFEYYLGNMTSLIQPQLLNSDAVVFNRFETLSKEKKRKLCGDIKNINKRTDVIFMEEASEDKLINNYFIPYGKYRKIGKSTIFAALLLVCSAVQPNASLLVMIRFMRSIATVFLSILMEAVPFILLGAFLSSVIQLFIPSGWITKKFSQRNIASFLVASVAGLFLPICDCGTAPIVSGLLKKDMPLPQTITFWLASSAVNPVVLISVYYAFPERPYLVLVRLITGVLIALITGFLLEISKIKTSDVTIRRNKVQYIGSEMLALRFKGKLAKVEAAIKGAKFEFFRVVKYVILGALISAFLQTVMPQAVKNNMNNRISMQFISMMAAAMFMSTCSTSNAFIGRSFLRDFATIPVMSFIVLGPMLDLKNMLMLSEILKKRFLLLLAVIVGLSGFIIFHILALYL